MPVPVARQLLAFELITLGLHRSNSNFHTIMSANKLLLDHMAYKITCNAQPHSADAKISD
jgi:hypothetical protein